LKNQAAVQISIWLNWGRILVSLSNVALVENEKPSNVALVDCLGVMALTEKE
jgi:hypothetical protein